MCPNKNSPEWKELVRKYGEVDAFLIFDTFNGDLSMALTSKAESPVKSKIESLVASNPDYYRTAYKTYLTDAISDKPRTVENMTQAFFARVEALDGKLEGDTIVTPSGSHLLFPETREEYKLATNVPEGMQRALDELSMRFGIPYKVINEPNIDFKGKYVNDGDRKLVLVNIAHADATTALHEYYHPFVRLLLTENKPLFDLIEKEARQATGSKEDGEELVTEYLAKLSRDRQDRPLLQKFFHFISSLFRKVFPSKNSFIVSQASTLKQVLDYLDGKVDVSSESSLTKAYKSIIDEAREMALGAKRSATDSTAKLRTDYIAALKAAASKLFTNDNSSFYMDENGKEVARRLTPFIGDKEIGEFSMRNKKFKWSLAEARAREIFKDQDKDQGEKPNDQITDKVTIEGEEITFNELVSILDDSLNRQRMYGKLVHAYIQFMLEKDSKVKEQARDQALKYLKDYDPTFTGRLEDHLELAIYTKELKSLIKTAGLNLNIDVTDTLPEEVLDKIAAEVTIKSDLFTDKDGNFIASTIDGFVQHPNGEVSMLDWKTGDVLRDMNTNFMMQYGEKFGVADSRISRGHLELAFRTMILKEKFPDMRFRDIQVIKVDKYGKHKAIKMDLEPYLLTIGEYYRVNKPEVYKTLKEKKMLDFGTYLGIDAALVKVQSEIKEMPFEEQLSFLQAKIDEITSMNTEQEIKNSSYLSEKLNQYTNALLYARKQPFINLNSKTSDMTAIGDLKNFSEVDNPKVQVLHNTIVAAKQEATERAQKYQREHDEKLKAVLQTDGRTKRIINNLFTAAYAVTFFTNPWLFGGTIVANIVYRRLGIKRKEMYNFMWRESTNVGKPGWFMNTKDTYLLNGREVPLNKAQREYRDFIHSTMKREYEKTMNEIVGYKEDKVTGRIDYNRPVTRAEKLGKPNILPEDFMPRTPASVAEMRENESFFAGYAGVQTHLKRFARIHLTNFMEEQYNEAGVEPIPVRFAPTDTNGIITSGNHSFDVQEAYKTFMGSLIYKQTHDPLYSFALGVKNVLDAETDDLGNKMYEKLPRWLDDQISGQILNTPKQVNITRHWTLKPNKWVADKLGIPHQELKIPQDKMIRLLKTSVSHSIMAFKLVSGVRNALTIISLNMSQMTKKGVNWIMGVPPDDFTPDVKTSAAALAEMSGVFKDQMLGKDDVNKLMLMAKEFNWMPDNYHYDLNKESFLAQTVELGLMSHAFMFNSLPESYGSLWHLALMMKSMKYTDKDGKQYNVYDAYKVENGELVWTKGVRGKVKVNDVQFKELSALDPSEIKNMKRQYEKLMGSYRKEEKTALEATVLGEFLVQFKKFFYSYMKNLFASEYKDVTVGRYVINKDMTRPNDVPVFEWEYQVTQGRLRILAAAFMATFSKRTYADVFRVSDPNADPYSKKRQMAELINTLLWLAILTYVFAAMWGDDDDEKDTATEKLLGRVVEDASMALNPKDMFSTLEKPIVAADKIAKVGNAMMVLITEGMWGEKTKEGLPKGGKTIIKSIPWLGGRIQMMEQMSDYDPDSQTPLFNILPTR